MVSHGTKLVVLPYNTSVELIMQDTSILGAESHPLHLHGFNFFVVGQGFGNFDPKKDPANFNLVDPLERNIVGVPSVGWVAVQLFSRQSRCIVHALLYRIAHELGLDDGLGCLGWKASQSQAASSTS
ncbi:hypothetical protein POTOM_006611 [Populus tomentosa]|uniref:Plastocyanin-like domain-containing protein n=1 Tax=Populus tomentosa TaxID=118781 RepID=A0A8X8APL4_POPTO|nr:hypothetical protein POTOM_006611 [Populus tomentosa]